MKVEKAKTHMVFVVFLYMDENGGCKRKSLPI
jgi:hypothetical protein